MKVNLVTRMAFRWASMNNLIRENSIKHEDIRPLRNITLIILASISVIVYI